MENPTKLVKNTISRRDILKLGVAAGAVTAIAAGRPLFTAIAGDDSPYPPMSASHQHAAGSHGDSSGTVGDVDLAKFDPTSFLTQFNWGTESLAENGQTVREWDVVAIEKDIEVAPGIFFPAWTFNGQVPGPTIRATLSAPLPA